MVDLFNLLVGAGDLCDELKPILRIVGIVIWGIRVAVPVILIVVGSIDLAKAVTEKSEDKIKEAQNKLVKKAIAAGLVFLVSILVTVVMKVVGHNEYAECMPCVDHPFRDECTVSSK